MLATPKRPDPPTPHSLAHTSLFPPPSFTPAHSLFSLTRVCAVPVKVLKKVVDDGDRNDVLCVCGIVTVCVSVSVTVCQCVSCRCLPALLPATPTHPDVLAAGEALERDAHLRSV